MRETDEREWEKGIQSKVNERTSQTFGGNPEKKRSRETSSQRQSESEGATEGSQEHLTENERMWGGAVCRETEGAPDPVFDISPCSVDKGCHPLVLGALTAVCSHHPSPAQETIDQPDSTALVCVCVIAHMCVLCCSVGKNMCKQRLCASARARASVFLHLCVCLFVPGLKCQNLHWSCTELAQSTRLSLCFYMSVLLFVMS